MSSFIVLDTTLNSIACAVYRDDDAGYIRRQLADSEGINTPEELGAALRSMNHAAVTARYRADAVSLVFLAAPRHNTCIADTLFPTTDYTFRPVIPRHNIHLIKSLDCYLYQCSEGAIPERPLYKILREYQRGLAMAVVRNHAAWDTGSWG